MFIATVMIKAIVYLFDMRLATNSKFLSNVRQHLKLILLSKIYFKHARNNADRIYSSRKIRTTDHEVRAERHILSLLAQLDNIKQNLPLPEIQFSHRLPLVIVKLSISQSCLHIAVHLQYELKQIFLENYFFVAYSQEKNRQFERTWLYLVIICMVS